MILPNAFGLRVAAAFLGRLAPPHWSTASVAAPKRPFEYSRFAFQPGLGAREPETTSATACLHIKLRRLLKKRTPGCQPAPEPQKHQASKEEGVKAIACFPLFFAATRAILLVAFGPDQMATARVADRAPSPFKGHNQAQLGLFLRGNRFISLADGHRSGSSGYLRIFS
ncbi:hypothetical protein ERJ75_001257100 [Trypanosoma vivax]|nr:hypothetical protein TRVL_09171 [Trypanosoma vivax]KAH8609115.1 hypothetical protein ERJ75_001257100 [Trypanosoma vivax]